MFERGFVGHHTPVLYQPVIQVPLLILESGQQRRRDVFTATSAVDVLTHELLQALQRGDRPQPD